MSLSLYQDINQFTSHGMGTYAIRFKVFAVALVSASSFGSKKEKKKARTRKTIFSTCYLSWCILLLLHPLLSPTYPTYGIWNSYVSGTRYVIGCGHRYVGDNPREILDIPEQEHLHTHITCRAIYVHLEQTVE